MNNTLQILANSLVSGLILSLVAIGFTFIFRVTKVFHLAHGGVLVSGAYACWWMFGKTSSWWASAGFGILLAIAVVYLMEITVYRPLSERQHNQSISLIASMGLYIILINLVALLFGNENKSFEQELPRSLSAMGIILTQVQLVQIIAATTAILLFWAYLKWSGSSLCLRALVDSETISKVFSINTKKERIKVFISGSILAVIAGLLKTLEVGVSPQSGMSLTLTGAVVTILVARTDIRLIVLVSIALAVLQNFIEWFLDAQWKEGLSFFILLVVILFRTEGIISYNLRKDKA